MTRNISATDLAIAPYSDTVGGRDSAPAAPTNQDALWVQYKLGLWEYELRIGNTDERLDDQVNESTAGAKATPGTDTASPLPPLNGRLP